MASLIGIRLIAQAKLTGYLLNADHPEGGPKARFFIAHGFSADVPAALSAALLAHADANEIRSELVHPRGVNRAIIGPLQSPDGRNPSVKVIWVQDTGTSIQRFVTAYPMK